MRVVQHAVWVIPLIVSAARVPAAVCTWNGTWDTVPTSAADAIVIAGGGNLDWDASLPATVASWTQEAGYGDTVTVHTVHGAVGFTNLTISGDAVIAGGVLAHRPNTTIESNRLFMTVHGNLTVAEGAAIGRESLGYAVGQGPGGVVSGGNGATHGGRGGNGPMNIYGSIFAPVNLGSGGGTGGSIGGGAIRLIVAGALTNNGIITASTRPLSYSGAGGSVYITAGTLAGAATGRINASGTPNGSSHYGGGGGRVAVILTEPDADFSQYVGGIQAYGGWVGARSGAAGTVYLETLAQGAGHGALIIDNAGGFNLAGQHVYTLMPTGTDLSVFDRIVITNDGFLAVTTGSLLDFGDVTLHGHSKTRAHIAIVASNAVAFPDPFSIGSYTLNLNSVRQVSGHWIVGTSGRLSHSGGMALDLTIDGHLTVMAGGDINVDARGGGGGPGAGITSGYGGLGGDPVSMGATYGSITAPTDRGSGGGGGAILLTVTGALTNHGIISSLGGSKASGGTVNLTVGSLVGSASAAIRATGGGGDNQHSGGGGRVAITLTDPDADFDPYLGAIQALGGFSHQHRKGAAGTVFTTTAAQPPGAGTVRVNNNNYLNNDNTNAVTSLPAFAASTEHLGRTDWIAENRGKIGLVTDAMIRGLTLNANGFLELDGHTLTTILLTVADRRYKPGVYSAADLGDAVIDRSGGGGRVIVLGVGSVLQLR